MMNWLRPSNAKRIIFFLASDTLLSIFTLYSAYLLRFNFMIPPEFLTPFWSVFLTLLVLKLTFISFFKNYTIVWRFYALREAKNLVLALTLAYGIFFGIYTLSDELFSPFPRSVIIIDFLLSLVMLGSLRLFKRLLIESRIETEDLQSTIIIGISSNTASLIKTMLDNPYTYYPVGIIALQPKNFNMIHSSIGNLRIAGFDELPAVVRTKKITAAIIDASLPQELLREIYQQLNGLGIETIKRSSLLEDRMIQDLSIEDLLARHPKDLDRATIKQFIQGKIVCITGAGGSIGSEIALQCHLFGANKLILIDHSEYNLYQIGEKLPHATLRLLNILDKESLNTLFLSSKPDIVIHAAAYKHVPLCEENINAALTNNILGSRNLIDTAIEHNVAKIVIISTDKAVRPTNVMGASKRVVELYAQNVDPKNSEIVAVRFGNVLGSSGSVIPKFKAQIDNGGPITLTHPDITRYFMLISEACQLVLQAAAIARGGELFILDMGEPIKIIDLAQTMIRLYATKPIEIKLTGLRPGEKLYEELLIDESEQKTAFDSILIAGSTTYPIDQLNRDIETLFLCDKPIDLLKIIVPEFIHLS